MELSHNQSSYSSHYKSSYRIALVATNSQVKGTKGNSTLGIHSPIPDQCHRYLQVESAHRHLPQYLGKEIFYYLQNINIWITFF